MLAGVAHTGLWLRYLHLVRDRPYARRGATIIILLNAAILLEVSVRPLSPIVAETFVVVRPAGLCALFFALALLLTSDSGVV